MEIPLPELIDKLSIVKLKIERIGEPHLKKEFESYEKAIKEFSKKGIIIDSKWVEELHEINGKIWDLEFEVRKVINCENYLEAAEKQLGWIELGKRALLVEALMKRRVAVKNKITELSGSGFKDIKINHCGS